MINTRLEVIECDVLHCILFPAGPWWKTS